MTGVLYSDFGSEKTLLSLPESTLHFVFEPFLSFVWFSLFFLVSILHFFRTPL